VQARIVLVGSIGGRIAGPMLGPYHASKFGLVGLADTLRAELAPSGIQVALVEPGAIATPIWSRGVAAADELIDQVPAAGRERYAEQIATAQETAARSAKRGLPPQRAAQVIVKALTARNPRPRSLVGMDAHAAAVVARLPFRLRYRLPPASMTSGSRRNALVPARIVRWCRGRSTSVRRMMETTTPQVVPVVVPRRARQ
jgi:NAD(P)-dependent dehydrogenase (short-subunit alcohol dehydrogenase family)